MLDQNTDRMWYVIGAVIIGAAIIFILNGTMPELFASVGETFESKTKETTEVVDGIQPNTYKNLYTNGDLHWSDYATGYGWSMGDRSESVLQKNIKIKPNTTYELTYDKNAQSNYLIVLTHYTPFSDNVHNAMYGSKERIRELVDLDLDNRRARTVSWGFTTGPDENYVTITTGNSAVVDEPFGLFDVSFTNIRLHEVMSK